MISHAYGAEVTAAVFTALRAYLDSLATVAANARGTESSRTAAWLCLTLSQVRAFGVLGRRLDRHQGDHHWAAGGVAHGLSY